MTDEKKKAAEDERRRKRLLMIMNKVFKSNMKIRLTYFEESKKVVQGKRRIFPPVLPQ